MGRNYLPDCDHIWRTAGPVTAEVASYGAVLAGTFPQSQFFALAGQGDTIIRQSGGMYPALMNVKEREMRNYAERLGIARENKAFYPAQYP